MNIEADTARVKYIFLDIVGFTKKRSVEAQSDLVAKLNSIIVESLSDYNVSPERTIYLPTGDGVAIALFDPLGFDTPLLIAIGILEKLHAYNKEQSDSMRVFHIRIGINENVDNIVFDINKRKNVAGAGISLAQRIMDQADGNQILLGQSAYEILAVRERYWKNFRLFAAVDKHRNKFNVYQYFDNEKDFLNNGEPTSLGKRNNDSRPLTDIVAHYMGHAFKNAEFLKSEYKGNSLDLYATVLLSIFALNSVEPDRRSENPTPSPNSFIIKKPLSFSDKHQICKKQDWEIIESHAHYFIKLNLEPYIKLFQISFNENPIISGENQGATFIRNTKSDFMAYHFLSPEGIKVLKEQFPEIETKLDIVLFVDKNK